MTPVPIRTRSSLTRALIVAALLCFVGLQVQEAAHDHHDHTADDGLAHCLLCKSSADTPTLAAEPDRAAGFLTHCRASPFPVFTPRERRSHLHARGPPAIS